ncbi:amidase domain-containing protein [Shouchella patagoniensis]|uniref:amidase domain-containing protein n=1 Tax=Shouchella patagoniensis TaxID=228576 RepID=UPI0009958AFA|nr:amidase domain-containing protein [Shouchella patagoniensis]
MKRKLIEALHENIRLMNISYLNGDPTMFEEVEAGAVLLEKKELAKRDANIVSSQISGDIISIATYEQMTQIDYVMLLERLITQEDSSYVEERVVRRRAVFVKNKLQKDVRLIKTQVPDKEEEVKKNPMLVSSARGEYDRRSAVRYAERWWNDYNPNFKQFEDNCTNFVSQCLLAGGAPMTSKSSKQRGWWYENNKSMSLSWSVAHSLRWYLSGARTGLRGEEKYRASDLIPGDIICYDFNGSGKWDHNAIVVAKDRHNEPLVNAQTVNSRLRYWTYQNSPAYTPDIQYKFFRIVTD